MDSIISRKEALELGLKTYYTGKACKHGHLSQRYSSNLICVQCMISHNVSGKDARRACKKKYEERNAEKVRISKQIYNKSLYERKKEEILEKGKEWRRLNPGAANALTMKRKLAKKQAVPGWYDHENVVKISEECHYLTLSTNTKYNSDHIVPIQSDFVCGLHWSVNLQIISALDNIRKSNRYWPDMPDTSDPELKALVKAFKSETKNKEKAPNSGASTLLTTPIGQSLDHLPLQTSGQPKSPKVL